MSDERLEQLKVSAQEGYGAIALSTLWLIEQVEQLEGAIRRALDELGVPGEGYPAPVVEAVTILRAALGEP